MVILEILALGKPFVTTPVSGASEELCRNQTCGLIASRSPDDFAEKVVRLLSDPQLYQSMSQTARLHSDLFTLDKSVAALERLLEAESGITRDTSASNNPSWPCMVKYIFTGLFYFDFHAFKKTLCSCFKRKSSFQSAVRQMLQFLVYVISLLGLPLKFVLLLSYLFFVKGQAHEKNY